jgi:hypothetical protein
MRVQWGRYRRESHDCQPDAHESGEGVNPGEIFSKSEQVWLSFRGRSRLRRVEDGTNGSFGKVCDFWTITKGWNTDLLVCVRGVRGSIGGRIPGRCR